MRRQSRIALGCGIGCYLQAGPKHPLLVKAMESTLLLGLSHLSQAAVASGPTKEDRQTLKLNDAPKTE